MDKNKIYLGINWQCNSSAALIQMENVVYKKIKSKEHERYPKKNRLALANLKQNQWNR